MVAPSRKELMQIVVVELNRTAASIYEILDARRASGLAERSLRVTATDTVGTLSGINYTNIVSTGRGAGRVPARFTEIIKQWVNEKGAGNLNIQSIPYVRQDSANWQPKYTALERGINRFSYFVARKIAREGSKRFRDKQPNEFEPMYRQAVERVKERMLNYLVKVSSSNGNDKYNRR